MSCGMRLPATLLGGAPRNLGVLDFCTVPKTKTHIYIHAYIYNAARRLVYLDISGSKI